MYLSFILGVIGLLLIYLEFFIPGGVLVILGGGFLIGSAIVFSLQKVEGFWLFFYFFILLASAVFTCKFALWQIKRSRKKKSFYLEDDQEGFFASEFKKDLIGKMALAHSDLKPSGHIFIEGEQLQAVSETMYIDKGSKVMIVGGKGAYLIVKKAE
jgi:membrane-bound serine protease (ClpP class)